MTTCDRCGRETVGRTMSWFNEQMICTGDGSCGEAEHAHPDIGKAKEAELAATRAGDTNYAGIGLPADLRGGRA